MKYIVKHGDTIWDIAYNTTGSIGAVDAIMDENNIFDYSEILSPETELEVSTEIKNNAARLKADKIPFNSNYLSQEVLDELISDLIEIITNDDIAVIALNNNYTVITFGEDNVAIGYPLPKID